MKLSKETEKLLNECFELLELKERTEKEISFLTERLSVLSVLIARKESEIASGVEGFSYGTVLSVEGADVGLIFDVCKPPVVALKGD